MLKKLTGIKKIDGFDVLNIDDLARENPDQWDAKNRRFNWDWFKKNVYPKGNYIVIDNHKNSITFKLQDGSVNSRVNGCKALTMIKAALLLLE